MWREVDGIVKQGAVFATNTSSLPVVNQAVATERPERFLGLHFFNPAQVMPLLEVVQTVTTGEDALKTGFEVGEKLGKTCVHARDKTGFIVNRLLVPYMLDAIRAHEEGVGAIDQIDAAMKAGANHPMGPLTLADFVGLDTLAAIADVMFDEYRERRFAAPPHAAQDGGGGALRAQVRQRLLRLLGREADSDRPGALSRPSRAHGRRRHGRRNVQHDSIERIRSATFSISRKGYDKREVEGFLNKLADWLEAGGGDQARSDLVKRELERVGEKTARILSEAEDSGEQLRTEAQEEAGAHAEPRQGAGDEHPPGGRRVRGSHAPDADQYARKDAEGGRATDAAGDARDADAGRPRETIADAQAKARRIVEEGAQRRGDIEAVIGDLVRHRDTCSADSIS